MKKMGKFGIDISNHNGDIDFVKVAKEVSFVIIRAGYGQNNIDARCIKNIEGCIKYKIPFGLYWFSYALNESMAKKEAEFLCNIADKYKPDYPLCFDWEYDSDEYAKKNHVDTSKSAMLKKAIAFLETVKERGYYPMLYTNLDYINRGFGDITNRYDVWLAQWGVSSPSVTCGIWQTSSNGVINGIGGNVDKNIAYVDYPSIIKNKPSAISEIKLSDEMKKNIYEKVKKNFYDKYTKIANEIIQGKYGNGDERKKWMRELGYDYDVAQIFVTEMIKVVK